MRQPRARLSLLLFLASSLFLVVFPQLDLRVSSWFYRGGGFYLADQWWATFLHASVGYFLCIGMVAVLGSYGLHRLSRRKAYRVDGRVVVYLFSVLVLGAGLIVNVVFKNNFGRARPRDVTYFGGSSTFTPAFVVSDQCDTNCSFSCGAGAGAFFALALALALSRRRRTLVAAAGFGGLVSFSRVASGAHYLSDTVTSFFVMWIVADVLYFYMLQPEQGLKQPPAEAQVVPRQSPIALPGGLDPAPAYGIASLQDTNDGSP